MDYWGVPAFIEKSQTYNLIRYIDNGMFMETLVFTLIGKCLDSGIWKKKTTCCIIGWLYFTYSVYEVNYQNRVCATNTQRQQMIMNKIQ